MTAPEIAAALRALEERFRREEQNLNRLDQAVGDGDHGATMVRGFSAITANLPPALDGADAGALLTRAGQDFVAATGGASGTLFASLLREFGAHCDERFDAKALRNGLTSAAARITRLGKAAPGDKTMIDALAPACAAIDEAQSEADSLGSLLAAAATAAERGAEATVNMVARRGRARHVPEGGRGHADPGATSIALMLRILAEQVEQAA